jgi:hypothetical protein
VAVLELTPLNTTRIEETFAFNDQDLVGHALVCHDIQLLTWGRMTADRLLFLLRQMHFDRRLNPPSVRKEKLGSELFECVHLIYLGSR